MALNEVLLLWELEGEATLDKVVMTDLVAVAGQSPFSSYALSALVGSLQSNRLLGRSQSCMRSYFK